MASPPAKPRAQQTRARRRHAGEPVQAGDAASTSTGPAARTPNIADELRQLGEALQGRCDEVRVQAIARAADSGVDLGHAFVRASFERICTIATIAVSNWMSGGSPEDGRDAGREAWQLFGELAAQRA